MNRDIKRFLDMISEEAPEMITFDLECNKCEFQRIEPLELIAIVTEESTKRTTEIKTITSYIGFPISFEIVYCYDITRPNYHKLQIRSVFPSYVLSTLDLHKLGFTTSKPVIQLESIFKFTFRDKYNTTRKRIAMQIADKEHPVRYNEKETSHWHLGAYQKETTWIEGSSTPQFLINWIKLSLINGYVSRKVDIQFFEVHELIEDIDRKREDMLWERYRPT